MNIEQTDYKEKYFVNHIFVCIDTSHVKQAAY